MYLKIHLTFKERILAFFGLIEESKVREALPSPFVTSEQLNRQVDTIIKDPRNLDTTGQYVEETKSSKPQFVPFFDMGTDVKVRSNLNKKD